MASGQIQKSSYGSTADGNSVDQYTLTNANQLAVTIITFGGIVTSLRVPDRSGKLGNIVLGFDNLADYEKSSPYFGAIIGRYGNRIANGRFNLDGKEYTLALNDGPNALHGGMKGFDKQVWNAKEIQSSAGVGL